MGTEERDGVSLTHLDEPLFDGSGATKRDLVDYLDAVSGLILPELRGRPLSVIRVRAGQQPNLDPLRKRLATIGAKSHAIATQLGATACAGGVSLPQ